MRNDVLVRTRAHLDLLPQHEQLLDHLASTLRLLVLEALFAAALALHLDTLIEDTTHLGSDVRELARK